MTSHATRRPRYLLRWDHSQMQLVDRDVVKTQHRLGELPMMDLQRLANLIESHPRCSTTICSMGLDPSHSSEWQTGQLSPCRGTDAIDAIRNGRFCLSLEDIGIHHPELSKIVARLYSELAECHVGLRFHDQRAHLMIASPGALQYYRCDHRPSIRWQLQGSQSIHVYPSQKPFVDPATVQQVATGNTTQHLYYEPAFDAQQTVHQLNSSEMLALIYPAPYRVQCGDELSVWLQTDHHTTRSRRQRNIYQANERLSRWLPPSWCAPQTEGVWATIKNLGVELLGPSRLASATTKTIEPTFVVDPKESASERNSSRLADQTLLPINGLSNEIETPVVLER